ncbi:MAG TPA: SCO family protein [Bryobacteraceae bacterium]|nr:SCO family protein [Bryobacteraceae bacterium]
MDSCCSIRRRSLLAPLLSAAFLLALAACRHSSQLPTYGTISEFTLIAQDGQAFSSRELKGNVWVADFFFTHCLGPCPRMGSQMHKIEMTTKNYPNVRLVSFTVDPARDTPIVLADYSKHFLAEPGRWFFLTGAQQTLQHLCRDDFKLGNVDGSLMHSTRFVLVDGHSQIRGYYETSQSEGHSAIDQLIADLKALASERS